MVQSGYHTFSLLRLLLVSVGLAIVWVLAGWVMAPDSARADENDGLLGGVVGDVVSAVDAPLGAVTHSAGSAVSTVVDSVTEVTPKPVDQARPVTAIVAPVAEVVDPIVATVPVVSDLVGSTPVADVATPVANVIEDSLGDVVGSPGAALPLPDGALPLPGEGVLGAGDQSVVAELPADAAAAAALDVAAGLSSVTGSLSAADWAASLPVAATAGGSAFLEQHAPATAPRSPLGDVPLPAAPGASGTASSSGGPAGAGLLAIPAGSETAAPLSAALLIRAGDDTIPSTPARDLGSTPD
jgi:hypothetical protein